MNEILSEQLFDECIENMESAPDTLRESYNALDTAIEKYVAEVQKHMFQAAYKMGYESGIKIVNVDSQEGQENE